MNQTISLHEYVIEHAPFAVVYVDLDGRVLYLNDFARVHLHLHESNPATETLFLENFVSTHQGEPSWSEVRQILLAHGGAQTTMVNVSPQGMAEETCELRAFRVDNAQESTIVVILRDITHTLITQQQIEKKNLEMAKINSELIRSNSELKRVSELKSNFLSIASHELKTPLTSIKGYSDIIIDTMKDSLEGGVFRMIESINRAADRLHRVVNNILDVTRIEQKRLRLKPEQLNLVDVARGCVDELSQFSAKRDIRFRIMTQGAMPQFYGDRLRMQQVFTNLFSNSLKYSPDHTTVDIYFAVDSETQFHIKVHDHGIGISKDEQKNVFDPFYEVGSTFRHTSDQYKFMGGGTGLGLSIVKGIVERHGGKIWVESEGYGEVDYPGSVFHLLLPLQSAISWDDDETKILQLDDDTRNEQMVEEDANNAEKPLILLIDADKEAVEIARMVLETAFEVLVSETGEEGLRLAFQKRPSLILLDSYLPGLDGYRICRILRSQEETRRIPVAFFSAGTQNEQIQKCFVCGADDFIVKPFSGKELVEKIWRILMRKKEVRTFN